MARRISVVTGGRAEYGLLYWLLKEIEADAALELQLVVTGMHLSEKFGNTYRAIETDGFDIAEKVDMEIGEDRPAAQARSMGRGIVGMTAAFARLRPDIVVVLGDRYEIFAAAQAAMLSKTPIAHIHGGEITEAAMDDAMRHAITKMAHLHFVAAAPYRDRVIRMGEAPERVFVTGAPGLDNIARLDLPDVAALQADLKFPLRGGFFLVTYHPATLGETDPGDAVRQLLGALDEFPQRPCIITGVNADPGHDAVSLRLADYAAANPDRVLLRQSLGQRNYLGAMKHCAAVIGNSSSGIIEAPAMNVPTVNIGDRQKGRIRAASVIDCIEDQVMIVAAINEALSPAFAWTAFGEANPYGEAGASGAIKDVLKGAPLDGILIKQFYDVGAAP